MYTPLSVHRQQKGMMTAVSEVMRQKDVITTKMVLQRFGELYSLPEEGT